MKRTFRLVDLLWLTGYFAVVAWLVSLKMYILIPVWLGTVFGFELAARSDFAPHLITLTICGMVLGIAVSMTIAGWLSVYQSWPYLGLANYPAIGLSTCSGLTALAIFWWLCKSVRST